MTRTEILTRYRRLRQISKEHHRDVMNIIAPDVVLEWAKRIGLMEGKTLMLDNEHEMTLVEDLATYLPRLGHARPVDRYARTAGLAPGSDEAMVLEAMRHSRFSLWRVERRHETAGLILRDMMRGEDVWLVDETMEENPPLRIVMAGRFLMLEQFAITARIVVPVATEMIEDVFDRTPVLRRIPDADALAGDPRFAIGIYRVAVAQGVMDGVQLKRP